MVSNIGSSKGAWRQFTSGLAHFWACVHDNALICRPTLVKFGVWIHFAKSKKKFFPWRNRNVNLLPV